MKKIQLFLLQFLLISITQHTNAQLPVKTEYTVEMGGTSGKGTYAPMWLTANRQGLSSANTENGYLRAGIAHTMPLNQHFGFSAGLDLATAYNFTSSFIIQQAYADLSYRWLNLSIGSKERLPELKNSKLSSGGMVESNNARPIPQIRLEVPDYVAIPGTHKWLHLKGHIAYGRFTDDKWQEHFTSIGNP
ncbi:capsule assembly Wzi family protein, partial [Phocaeicola vulgatus]|nr:capsule assembly Wzi family protein [Phocaeicola vulgatus]MDB0879430.1 capsule assembly Wzi family protein [Phocaeicola vulgatus]